MTHRYSSWLSGLVFLVTIFLMIASPVLAGEMVIEEGTVFTETMTKDGRRVEVTKTYTQEGVVIHQKIYDEATGALIREKSRVNPIKDHVTLVAPGTGSIDQVKEAQTEQEKETVKPAATLAPTVTPAPIDVSPDSPDQELMELEATVGPDAMVEAAQSKYALSRVESVFVGQADNQNQIAVEAVRTKRFLGLITIELPVKIILDSQTGELLDQDQSLGVKILERLSI